MMYVQLTKRTNFKLLIVSIRDSKLQNQSNSFSDSKKNNPNYVSQNNKLLTLFHFFLYYITCQREGVHEFL